MWGIDAVERHRKAPGDLILIYADAPELKLLGRAELALAVHDSTPGETEVYPGDSTSGVLLAHVEDRDPPVPMSFRAGAKLTRQRTPRAEFEAGVVRITANEYETALAVAAERAISTG
jgi:hypothetical protein